MGKLTALAVAKKLKPGRHGDGGGLYLDVKPSGARSWVFLFRHAGKSREAGLGPLKAVSLADARRAADEARRRVRLGENPIEARQKQKVVGLTFGDVAKAFVNDASKHLRGASHRRQLERALLEQSAGLGDSPVADIKSADILTVLRPVWERTPPTGKKMRSALERLFAYAKAHGFYTGANPALWHDNLDGALQRQRAIYHGHRPSMPHAEVASFMRTLATRDSKTAAMMRFAILTCARSDQARSAVWGEVDLGAKVWAIPMTRMKGKAASIVPGEAHRVPLSDAAIDVLRHVMPPHPDPAALVFEGDAPGRPLADVNAGRELRRAGYEVGVATMHGFRASFRTWVAEVTAFDETVAERCLAHAERSAVVRAYQHSDRLDKRRVLMDSWAAYCCPNG